MNTTPRLLTYCCLMVCAGVLAACAGTAQQKVDFKGGYAPAKSTKIEVGKVTNSSGAQFQMDVEKMLRDSLTSSLKREGLLYDGKGASPLVLDTKIIDYAEGDAFKRWLMPGSGATILSIQSDLLDAGNVVGTVEARRTITAGGLYSVGAGSTVFGSLSDDVVNGLAAKIPK